MEQVGDQLLGYLSGYIRGIWGPFTRIYIYIYIHEIYVVVVYNGKKMEITTVSSLSGLPAAAMTCSFTGHAYTLHVFHVGVTGRGSGAGFAVLLLATFVCDGDTYVKKRVVDWM